MALVPFSTLLQSFPGYLMPTSTGLFPRHFKKTFPIAARGEGCWIIAADGRRFLDASGQAAVVSIGHGVPEIGRAMAEQSSRIAFAHTSQFHTAPAERLAKRLLAMAPQNFRNGGRVYFTSGGSEATETAIKLARQFHLENGQKERYRVLSRRQSYHGSTLGAMSVSGNVARRASFEPLIAKWGHIAPCFCYHCPFEKTFPQCELACADDLQVHLSGQEREQAGAVLVSARVVEAFEHGSRAFVHGFTYQAHPVSAAAGNAVLDYLEAHKLFDRVNAAGQELRRALSPLQSHPNVGDVRGLGLLLGVEFVKNKAIREPFPKEQNIAEKIREACLEEGVLTYPTQGCIDGLRGAHILFAPPFTISSEECALIARALKSAAAKVFST